MVYGIMRLAAGRIVLVKYMWEILQELRTSSRSHLYISANAHRIGYPFRYDSAVVLTLAMTNIASAGELATPTVYDFSAKIQPEYMGQVLGNYIDDALANSNHIVGVHYFAFFIAAPCGTWPGWINPGNRLNQADTPDYSLLWASRRALHDMCQKSPD